MFCYQCGTNNTETTRYCTRCGENLEAVRQSLMGIQPAQPPSLLTSKHVGLILFGMTLLGIGGFAILCAAVTAIVLNSPHEGQVIAGFLALFGFTGLCFIISRLSRLLSMTSGAAQSAQEPPSVARQLASGLLPHFSNRLPPPSVTENTTSSLPQHEPARAKES